LKRNKEEIAKEEDSTKDGTQLSHALFNGCKTREGVRKFIK
jgi:hypothetical protein